MVVVQLDVTHAFDHVAVRLGSASSNLERMKRDLLLVAMESSAIFTFDQGDGATNIGTKYAGPLFVFVCFW